MIALPTATSTAASAGLVICRLLAGGAFLLAGFIKLKGGPLLFQMSIEGFKMVPWWGTMALAYFLPWLEIIAGGALVLGVWSRQAATITFGLYSVFTFGLASALIRGLNIDCGCFGGLFGESQVGWHSVARNMVFMAASAAVMIHGGGRFALTRDDDSGVDSVPADARATAVEATP